MGAGKTSILEAISFALFGKLASNLARKDMVKRGANKAEITLFFSTNTSKFMVERTVFLKKIQQAKLSVFTDNSWNVAVEGVNATSKSIEEILNIDSMTYMASMYASQGEIKEMLETPPGKRREQLDKLLGIDVYEKIWTNFGEAKTIVLQELTKVQETGSGYEILTDQLQTISKTINKNTQEKKWLDDFLLEIKHRLEPLEEQKNKMTELKLGLDHIHSQYQAATFEHDNTHTKIQDFQKKLAEIQEAELIYQNNEKFIQIEKQWEKEKNQMELEIQQKIGLQELIEKDEGTLNEANKRKIKLLTQLKTLQALQESLETIETSDIEKLKQKKVNLESKLEKIKTTMIKTATEIDNQLYKIDRVDQLSECPTCLQEVPCTHKEEIRKTTTLAVTKLKKDYSTIQETRQDLEFKLTRLNEMIDNAIFNERKYVELKIQIETLERCQEELDEEIEIITNIRALLDKNKEKKTQLTVSIQDLEVIDEKLQQIKGKIELAKTAEKEVAPKKTLEEMLIHEKNLLQKIDENMKKLEKAEKKVKTQYYDEKYENLNQEIQSLKSNQIKSQEGYDRLTQLIELDVLQKKKIREKIKKKKDAWNQLETLKSENELLDKLRKSIREVVQPTKRKSNVLNVSEAFQMFYQELSNDNIDHAALDEEGNIEVIRNGEPSPVNSLSGGETTCAALALRLAICSSLTKNQLLLLDEPTIHLDEMYRSNLRSFLSTHDFEQLVVATHDNTFNALPAHVFEVGKKRSTSTVTIIEFNGEH